MILPAVAAAIGRLASVVKRSFFRQLPLPIQQKVLKEEQEMILSKQTHGHKFSEAVVELQTKLASVFTHKSVTVDGYYGPITEKWVEAFQAKENLTVDGIAGPNTLKALNKHVTNPITRPVTDRSLSTRGIEFLIRWEGLRKFPYKDIAGYWTIGIGHLLTQKEVASGIIWIDERPLEWREGLSYDDCIDLKKQDLQRFEKAINNSVIVDLTQNQFDALVSFAYNVGVGAFNKSSVLKNTNAKNFDKVEDSLMLYIKARNPKTKRLEVSRGLKNRREAEIALWNDSEDRYA